MPKIPRVRVYPYKQGSRSAKTLSQATGGMVLKHNGSKFKPRNGDIVINWGAGNIKNFQPATVLNNGVSISQAANKKTAFQVLSKSGVKIPNFWTSKKDVPRQDHWPIVCRTKLTGHSGEGIVIANNPEELVDAPLYTQYVKKKDEYRVHVFRDNVFFIQRKARRLDVENPNWKVRNLENGFVFVEIGPEEVPEKVKEQVLAAVKAMGLDFGGVDIIWNQREEEAYVLEINTACGLEERTAERYAAALLPNI